MLVKTLPVGLLDTNCYVVADEATLDCAVIDPGADCSVILNYIEQSKFTVRAVLLTHGHYDHCMAVEPLLEATGAALYMSDEDVGLDIGNGWAFYPPDDTNFIEDDDVIEAGSLSFRAIACPGHTPGGMTYAIEDCLFTGDTLFHLSCGRYDFPGANRSALISSLQRLYDLEGDYEVFPGHMEASSLEYERRFNPCLARPNAI